MKTSILCRLGWQAAWLLAAAPLWAQTVTQTFTLRPGWNALWLEVEPASTRVGAVMAGLPVESVWSFRARSGSVDFIQDPAEPVWNRDKWLLYTPTNRLESFQNDLFHLQANHAFLVKLTNTASVTLAVSGRPSLQAPAWAPNAFTLRGFPVDPASPPAFGAFFAASPAHCDAASGRLQRIYRLSAAGQWTLAGPADLMQAGEACWVYTAGASSYQGPASVLPKLGDGLNYGLELESASLLCRNLTASPKTLRVTDLSAPAASTLSYCVFDAAAGLAWAPLPSPHWVTLAPSGTPAELRLAARRQDMPAEGCQTVLEITDGAGLRYLVPVRAGKLAGAASLGGGGVSGKSAPKGAPKSSGPQAEAEGHFGLWLGAAAISAVSEAHYGALATNYYAIGASGAALPLNTPGLVVQTNWIAVSNLGGFHTNPVVIVKDEATGRSLPVYPRVERAGAGAAPTPTRTEFPLRLLIHVDATGASRLLKEVIQMWKPGTFTNDSRGQPVVAAPGRYVLLTDETLLSQFEGAAVRNGQPAGRRFSTAGFDFPSTPSANYLPLTGWMARTNTLRGAIQLGPGVGANPFRHRYHPDHAQGLAVTRDFELEFTNAAPSAASAPGESYSLMSGIYRETVGGLHKSNIVASGTFTLRRVAAVAALNQ